MTSYRYSVLTFAVVANFSQVGARLVISPLVPDIVDTFGVSKTEIGVVLTGMWMAFALMQFPSGVLADRFGERRVILVSLCLTGLCSLLLWVMPSFLLFGLAAVLLGAGAGLYFSGGTSLLTKLFENTGQALGIHSAGSPLAGLVVPVAATAIAVRYGWRNAFLIGAVSGLGAFGLVAWRVRRTPPGRPDESLGERFHPAVVRDLLGRRSVAFVVVIAFVCMFSFQSFVSFFPTFLIEHRGLSQQSASLVFTGVFVLSALCQPFLGRLSDVFNRDVTLMGTLALLVVGFGLFIRGPGGSLLVVSVIILGLGFGFPGVLNSLIMDNFSEAEQGSGFGLVRTAFVFPGALGNVVTGTFADVTGWPTAYGVVMALGVVALVALLLNRILHLRLEIPSRL